MRVSHFPPLSSLGFYSDLSLIASRVIDLLKSSTSHAHLHQIQAQILHHRLHSHTTVAHHFIATAKRLSLLHSSLPLFLTHLHKPHVFICNILIQSFSSIQSSVRTAFSGVRLPPIPFSIYTYMLKKTIVPNHFTYPFLLKSLSDCREFFKGECIHGHVIQWGHVDDIYVMNSLLDFYASCRQMSLCCKLFDEMSQTDVVSWTILIMGFRKDGNPRDALNAFHHMHYAAVLPNIVTMVNALAASADCGAIDMGVWMHDLIKRNVWELDVYLGTSLVAMYTKCGRIKEGLMVFQTMRERNVYTWNAIIKGMALIKHGDEAVSWFYQMKQEGINPDEVTLLNVLNACRNSSMVDVGKKIFNSLRNGDYGFLPNLKHYSCMVDLLARTGSLIEAFSIIREMPFEPTKSMWKSLLSGCNARGHLELSECVTKKLVEMEPRNRSYHVDPSRLYAQMGSRNC